MTPLAASTAVWIFILVPLIVIWAIGVVDILRRDFGRGTKAARPGGVHQRLPDE